MKLFATGSREILWFYIVKSEKMIKKKKIGLAAGGTSESNFVFDLNEIYTATGEIFSDFSRFYHIKRHLEGPSIRPII